MILAGNYLGQSYLGNGYASSANPLGDQGVTSIRVDGLPYTLGPMDGLPYTLARFDGLPYTTGDE